MTIACLIGGAVIVALFAAWLWLSAIRLDDKMMDEEE